MPNLDSLEFPKRMVALFIGPSSCGKSTAAASFPKPHFWDFDLRIEGLKNCRQFIGQDISYERYPPSSNGQMWNKLNNDFDIIQVEINTRQYKYETLVIDSFTAVLKNLLHESLHLQGGKIIKDTKNKLGGLRIEGPADYQYEASAGYQMIQELRELPINVILTAHIIPSYGKETIVDSQGNVTENTYGETVVIGEKLSIREKIAANILPYFNEVYRFDKREVIVNGKKELRHFVKFESDIARSAIGLKGEHDITGKNFYTFWKAKMDERKPQWDLAKKIS